MVSPCPCRSPGLPQPLGLSRLVADLSTATGMCEPCGHARSQAVFASMSGPVWARAATTDENESRAHVSLTSPSAVFLEFPSARRPWRYRACGTNPRQDSIWAMRGIFRWASSWCSCLELHSHMPSDFVTRGWTNGFIKHAVLPGFTTPCE